MTSILSFPEYALQDPVVVKNGRRDTDILHVLICERINSRVYADLRQRAKGSTLPC